VERAALVLATTTTGLAVGIEEPVLLRLLAEATGVRPGNAKLGCHGATVTPLRNKATASSRWLGFRSHSAL
jgi:hypothetical protein